MKLIKFVEKACPCQDKIAQYVGEAEGCCWGPGTEVECDCGQVYILTAYQHAGGYGWIKKVIKLRDKITMTVQR